MLSSISFFEKFVDFVHGVQDWMISVIVLEVYIFVN